MKRKRTKVAERAGINYVRTIVEGHNCIFQEIDLGNDIGNDAYIEFVRGEDSTSCCVAVQIKSGQSYVAFNKNHLILKADREHFEYWRSHNLPIGAIVFSPADKLAAWCDITAYIDENTNIVETGPYNINIPIAQVFDSNSFEGFLKHFLAYQYRYRREENFAKALESFADIKNVQSCIDGIRSLFSYHRQRPASWYYLISCFANYHDKAVIETLALILTYLPGHGDIGWHRGNITDETVRNDAKAFLSERFGKEEVISLLGVVDEEGYQRGSLGQSIHAIIHIIQDRNALLESIAFDGMVPEDIRYASLVLLIYYWQLESAEACINVIHKYLREFPEPAHKDILIEILFTINEHGSVGFY